MASPKKFLSAVAVLWLLPVGFAFAAGAWVTSAGIIRVHVNEHGSNGSNVNVAVPGALGHFALWVLPEQLLDEASVEMEEWGPMVRAGVKELRRCPDGILVEVIERDEHVLIEKRGGSLIVDVESDDESVHVTMPLGLVSSALAKLDRSDHGRRGFARAHRIFDHDSDHVFDHDLKINVDPDIDIRYRNDRDSERRTIRIIDSEGVVVEI